VSFTVVGEEVTRYMRSLQDGHDDPVLSAMEQQAREHGFPIVGRLVGVTLDLLARAVGARRVFELGSGYGYSAYWFARAVGESGEVYCTDQDPENEKKASGYLGRAGLWDRIHFHLSDAVEALGKVPGEFDVIYNDIDKHGYPHAWQAARERVRVGGLYLCDNVLWSGHVADQPPTDRPGYPGYTKAIVEHNRLIAEDKNYLSTIVPTRDGVMVALRLR
jgi:caffeoyl-CoA O-methyltransferase